MDQMLSWGLSAIDTIFSTRKSGATEPSCPDGCKPSGYLIDYSGKWRLLCLDYLSVEDAEDLWIVAILMVGYVFLGLGFYLILRKIRKGVERVLEAKLMPAMIDRLVAAEVAQTVAIADLSRKIDIITVRLETLPPA